MIRFGRCDFVEDSKMSKRRDSGAYWCVNHSVRTTSAMRECLGAQRGPVRSYEGWNDRYPFRKSEGVAPGLPRQSQRCGTGLFRWTAAEGTGIELEIRVS